MRISDWSSDVCSSDLNSVWDTIQFALNGIIFVLLGEQLPAILAGAKETVTLTGHSAPWWLGIYVIAIVAGLAALRFIWVGVSQHGSASCRDRVGQYVYIAGVSGTYKKNKLL